MIASNPLLGTYPAVKTASDGVQPAAALYVSAEDRLFINAWNSATSAQLEIRWRMMRADGRVISDHQSVPLTAARATVSTMFDLCEGFLLGVTVNVSGATPKRGQTFVQVGLARGNTTNPEQGGLLISDYCTALDFAGWPGTPLRAPSDGPGFLRSITGTDPAAGVEISETVPTNARWRIQAFFFTLVTSAVVASRAPVLTIDDGANIYIATRSNNSQAATNTFTYTAGPGMTNAAESGFQNQMALPVGFTVPAGHRIRTVTFSLDPGDNYSAPQYVVEEWIEV